MKNIWEYTKYPLAGIGIVLAVLAIIILLGGSVLAVVDNLQWLLDTPETATKWDKIGKLYLTGSGVWFILWIKTLLEWFFNSIR